jgi:hypothetical protein
MLQAKALGISSDLGHEDAVPQDGERFSQRCPQSVWVQPRET